MGHDLKQLYKGRFFARRKSLAWRVPIVTEAIIKELGPSTLVDVGCANADYVAGFLDRGVSARGIEGTDNCMNYLEVPEYRVTIADIREPILIGFFDLAICLEVAEHIEPEYVETFVDNLCGFSNRILMSAAGLGAKGHGHFNCQPKDYWIEKFKIRKYQLVNNIVEQIRKHWESWRKKKEMSSYYSNLMYFERKSE